MIQLPVTLFVDRHRSHLTMQASELCEAKQVVLIALHPNCTHILQPADISVFKPLKAGWKQHVREWKFNNDQAYNDVVKSNFAPLLAEVFKVKSTPIIIQNGFRACGLYPFDSDNVDYTKCIKSRQTPQTEHTTSSVERIETFEEKCLRFVGSKIGQETLMKFKQSGEIWEGEERSKDLYQVWKSISEINPQEPVQPVVEDPSVPAEVILEEQRDLSLEMPPVTTPIIDEPRPSTSSGYQGTSITFISETAKQGLLSTKGQRSSLLCQLLIEKPAS